MGLDKQGADRVFAVALKTLYLVRGRGGGLTARKEFQPWRKKSHGKTSAIFCALFFIVGSNFDYLIKFLITCVHYPRYRVTG